MCPGVAGPIWQTAGRFTASGCRLPYALIEAQRPVGRRPATCTAANGVCGTEVATKFDHLRRSGPPPAPCPFFSERAAAADLTRTKNCVLSARTSPALDLRDKPTARRSTALNAKVEGHGLRRAAAAPDRALLVVHLLSMTSVLPKDSKRLPADADAIEDPNGTVPPGLFGLRKPDGREMASESIGRRIGRSEHANVNEAEINDRSRALIAASYTAGSISAPRTPRHNCLHSKVPLTC